MSFSTEAVWGMVALAVLLLIQLYLIMHDKNNPIEWWHFISSKGADGNQYADMTKLGQATGIFVCVSVAFIFAARTDTTALGFSALLGVILLYLGGVQAYQTYMRSRQNPPEKGAPNA